MKRLVSIFLSLMILLCCVVPVSATGFDPDTNGYTFDALPYLDHTYFDSRPFDHDTDHIFYLNLPDKTSASYISGIFESNDPGPGLSSNFGSLIVSSLGDNLFHFYGSLDFTSDSSTIELIYNKDWGEYIRFLTLEITPVDYVTDQLSWSFNIQGSYDYKSYNSPGTSPQYNLISDSFNVIHSFTGSATLDTPLLHPNVTNGFFDSDYVFNEANIWTVSYFYFDWTKYDRVDLVFWVGYDDLQDLTFYVDGVDVVKSIYPVSKVNHSYYVVSLDFSDLDPSLFSKYCYLLMRGYEEMNSSSQHDFFYLRDVCCFTRTVSNNFWPSWLTKIINKLDNIFTGRGQDQTAADSFNDSVADQSNELEDLTADLNAVTRPPLSDVNLSTSTMVDQSTIVLATSGIGSLLSNSIILRIFLMALTFALAGFILYGKR